MATAATTPIIIGVFEPSSFGARSATFLVASSSAV